MAEQLSTPRITAAYLDNFVGRVVMLVGKVTQLRGDQATLDSEGTVTVLLNRVSYQPRLVSVARHKHTRCIIMLTTNHLGCPSLKRKCRAGHWKGQPGPVDQGFDIPGLGEWCG
jgi:hypothetical protein